VRGLDYYTRTVFEFESDTLGAQSGLGGGGRYDGLVELLGGPPTPAVGWAAGIERVLLAAQADAPRRPPAAFVAVPKEEGGTRAFSLVRELWAAGLGAQMEQAGRSMKGQLKHADRIGARAVVIVSPDGLEVKDMRTGDQRPAADAAEAVRLVADIAIDVAPTSGR
jgi:histidyl-tRNA synthetase